MEAVRLSMQVTLRIIITMQSTRFSNRRFESLSLFANKGTIITGPLVCVRCVTTRNTSLSIHHHKPLTAKVSQGVSPPHPLCKCMKRIDCKSRHPLCPPISKGSHKLENHPPACTGGIRQPSGFQTIIATEDVSSPGWWPLISANLLRERTGKERKRVFLYKFKTAEAKVIDVGRIPFRVHRFGSSER
ncbi:hypothetical protein CEXT_714611 [Caerostris extrusa]|uniref:Uncharacterized protein n=1 Tax=Caerostris extrusa TaxID=172846 RepID=A0AAV4PP00_CAEEX|nr:hypothetical protein CEXT_714611 [Caerostris extrusa]